MWTFHHDKLIKFGQFCFSIFSLHIYIYIYIYIYIFIFYLTTECPIINRQPKKISLRKEIYMSQSTIDCQLDIINGEKKF